MLRHMDAALEISRGKRVLGLMIVEGEGGAAATAPSDHWLREADNQLLETTVADSLPHRDPGQRNLIAEGFLGVTTWQRVCAAFELGWPPYKSSGDTSRRWTTSRDTAPLARVCACGALHSPARRGSTRRVGG